METTSTESAPERPAARVKYPGLRELPWPKDMSRREMAVALQEICPSRGRRAGGWCASSVDHWIHGRFGIPDYARRGVARLLRVPVARIDAAHRATS
jgi:hypothetical protein